MTATAAAVTAANDAAAACQRLRCHLAYLGLKAAADALPALPGQARDGHLPLLDALEQLMGAEAAAAQSRKLASRLHWAALPAPWRLEDYDFAAQPGADEAVMQVYGTELSAESVSRITGAVLDEVRAWQDRPLDPVWAVVFLDAIVVKVRDNHVVHNKPAYLAVGVGGDGEKHVLGIWLAKTALDTAPAGEGARFWASVMTDLRNRGVSDILIACCDGLAGFEDAIHAAFPAATVQRCVVHLIRNSLRPVARRDAAAVAAELRKIYTAPGEEGALEALAAFGASELGRRYPRAVRVWEDAWDCFTPFLAFSPQVRRLLYTTNSIVIWSPRGVVFHVDHEGLRGRVLPGGRGYLPLSITRISRRSNACSAGANARLVA
jgi:hypothetical protein